MRSCAAHLRPYICLRPALRRRPPLWTGCSFSTTVRYRRPEPRHKGDDGPGPQPADNPNFQSILDRPQVVVRVKEKGNIVLLILLALMPITAFALGTWQVKRLGWKTELVAKLEDRILREPLPLPLRIDVGRVPDFDFRRIYATGRFRHDREMLVGPRMRDSKVGFLVVTPLERDGERDGDGAATVLVNRGWIARDRGAQRDRPDSLVTGEVTVEGLVREPWKKNLFTLDNRPEKGEFYFPDVHQMAQLSGSQPVWIDSTFVPDYLQAIDFEARGIPLGRPAVVGLRNQHAQYIFTWYSLAIATSIMFYMVVRKPSASSVRRIYINQ